jgi:uncharacterized small protein (DUF1192 family)
MFDEERPRKPVAHEVGATLDALSVEELQARIALLEDEIVRLKSAIEARGRTRTDAESVFKF